MDTGTIDQSTGALLLQLTQQMRSLARQEVDLAQAEMRQNMLNFQRNLVLLVVGAAIGCGGFLALLAISIIALAQVLPWWQAGVLIGGGALLLGIMFFVKGQMALRNVSFFPNRALATLLMNHAEVRR